MDVCRTQSAAVVALVGAPARAAILQQQDPANKRGATCPRNSAGSVRTARQCVEGSAATQTAVPSSIGVDTGGADDHPASGECGWAVRRDEFDAPPRELRIELVGLVRVVPDERGVGVDCPSFMRWLCFSGDSIRPGA
jgi:hypothetical protein